MNLYTKFIIIGQLILSSCASRPVGTNSVRTEFNSYYQNKRYQYNISDKDLERCPVWNRTEQLNPPHPAAKALSQAEEFMRTIPAPKDQFWTLDDLALEDFGQDHWAWRATFSVGGIVRSNPRTMQSWILMDGSLLKPKITPYSDWKSTNRPNKEEP